MKKALFKLPTPKSEERVIRNRTEELIWQFVDELNDCKRPQDKPWTFMRVRTRLAGYNADDMQYLMRVCRDARSFGAFFWVLTKTKKTT